MSLVPVRCTYVLDNLHCADEADGSGNAEPRGTFTFFKVDGETHRYEGLELVGDPYTLVTGFWRNGVDAGDDLPLALVGSFSTILRPIVWNQPGPGPAPLPGYLGCLVNLTEDDLSDFTNGDPVGGGGTTDADVGAALRSIVKTHGLANVAAVRQAINDGLLAIASARLRDDFQKIGYFVFLWDSTELESTTLANGLVAEPLRVRWFSGAGDWTITGARHGGLLTMLPFAPRSRPLAARPAWSRAQETSASWLVAPPAVATSTLVLSPNKPLRVAVALGENGQVLVASWNGDNHGPWRILDGARAVFPPAVVAFGFDQFMIAGVDDSGAVWTAMRSSAGAWPTIEIVPIGAGIRGTGSPSLVATSASDVTLFVRGADGHLVSVTRSMGRWGNVTQFAGEIIGSPAAAAYHGSDLVVFARLPDDQLGHVFQTNGRWSEWESLGGGLGSDPLVIADPARGVVDVLGRSDSDGTFSIGRWDAARPEHDPWDAWQVVGALPSDSPSLGTVTRLPNGDLELYLLDKQRDLVLYSASTAPSVAKKGVAGSRSPANVRALVGERLAAIAKRPPGAGPKPGGSRAIDQALPSRAMSEMVATTDALDETLAAPRVRLPDRPVIAARGIDLAAREAARSAAGSGDPHFVDALASVAATVAEVSAAFVVPVDGAPPIADAATHGVARAHALATPRASDAAIGVEPLKAARFARLREASSIAPLPWRRVDSTP